LGRCCRERSGDFPYSSVALTVPRGLVAEDLKEKYGYNHPPRAVQDVRDYGISIETYRVADSTGRSIAAYRFDLPTPFDSGKSGRKLIPKEIKTALLEKHGPRCALCGGKFNPTFLQVDHKVPYEVAGESEAEKANAFMLVCGSCNRTKSWACEHCENWNEKKEVVVCKSCNWARPENYKHVAMTEARRADIVWLDEKDAKSFDKFREASKKRGETIQDGIKKAVARSLE
jgi:hypothetical protein